MKSLRGNKILSDNFFSLEVIYLKDIRKKIIKIKNSHFWEKDIRKHVYIKNKKFSNNFFWSIRKNIWKKQKIPKFEKKISDYI